MTHSSVLSPTPHGDTCFPCRTITYSSTPSAYQHFPRWYGPSHLFTNGMTLLMARVLSWLFPFSKSTWYNPSVFFTAPGNLLNRVPWYSPDSHFSPFVYNNLYADQPNLHIPSDPLPSLNGPIQELFFPIWFVPASFSSQTVVEPYVLRLPTTSRRLLLQWTVVLMVAETAPAKEDYSRLF